MATLTITEALAEIKTIGKRKQAKQEHISQHIARMERVRDPLASDGGSAAVIARELQAIRDLDQRIVRIRRNIQAANAATTITLSGEARSITDWLTWRREVAPGRQALLQALRNQIAGARKEAQQKGWTVGAAVASATVVTGEASVPDVVVNVDEAQLAKDIETLAEQLGALDGQLSLKNATTSVEIGD